MIARPARRTNQPMGADVDAVPVGAVAPDGRPGPTAAAILTAFALGSVAQGVPVVIAIAHLDDRGATAGWVAAVAVARLAPYVVCSPVAGSIAAVRDPRAIWAITGAGRCVLALAVGVAVLTAWPPAVLVTLVFALVACGTPTYPTLVRMLHETVPAQGWNRASAFAAGVESAAFCAGPALGGLLVVVGVGSAMTVCTAMSVASAVLGALVLPAGRSARDHPAHTGLGWGWSSLLAPANRRPVAAVLGANLLAGLLATLLVALPAGSEPDGGRAFGLLSFANGVGALGCFTAIAARARCARRPLVPLGVAGVALAVLATSHRLALALAAAATFGACVLASEVSAMAAVGRSASSTSVAAAVGMLDAWVVAAMIVGATISAGLAAAVGTRPTLLLAGTAALVCCCGAALAMRAPTGSSRALAT